MNRSIGPADLCQKKNTTNYVEVWQRNDEQPDNPKAWYYRHYGPGEAIELFSLNIRLAMAEIYQDLDFAEDEEEDDEK